MKLPLTPLVGLVLASADPALAKEILDGPIAAKMLRVVDGDTLAVRALIWPGQRIDIKVRLAGIDAPELFRPACAQERQRARLARDFLVDHTGGQVQLFSVHLGKYAGRVIARVQTGAGEDLSVLLVQAGLAHTMDDPGSWCVDGS
jgi:endonuclease YncB( thermonuclease family)